MSLAWIVKQNGGKLTIGGARKLCRTTRQSGTLLINLLAAFESAGYEATLHEDMSWELLAELSQDDDQHVILSWWSDLNDGLPSFPEGHYSVVVPGSVSPGALEMYDSQFGKKGRVARYPRSLIEGHWYDWDVVDGVWRDYCRAGILVKKRDL